MRKSTFATLTAVVHTSGTPTKLVQFPHLASPLVGVSVTVRKGRRAELHRHAFKARMPGGHIGIFERKTFGGGRFRVGRLPIEEKPGPSIPRIFQFNGEESTTRESADDLQKNLDSEVLRILRGFR